MTTTNDITGDKILSKSGKKFREKYSQVFEDKEFVKGSTCEHTDVEWDLTMTIGSGGQKKYCGVCKDCDFMVFEFCSVIDKKIEKES